jgi:hypothetical protein
MGPTVGHDSVTTNTAFRNSMELLCEVASMKCVRLLVTAKQQIASVRAEDTELGSGNAGRLQNIERLFKV